MENQRIQIIPYKQYLIEQDCFDMVRPDWDKVAALGRKWERSTRASLQPLVERYQAGDYSVLEEIENNLETLAYSAAKKFSFETVDKPVFLNLAGEFNKRIPKDEERPEKMFVRFVPFSFSDEAIDEQFPKSIKTALNNYDPEKGTLFSTWFIRRFRADLMSLYKKYKGDAEKIINREQYEKENLSWSRTHISIPDKTDLCVGNFTTKQADWMSLVLESYPYDLGVKLRSEILGIDQDTDKNIRNGLAKKLGKWRMLHLSNNYGELYPLMHILGQARTRPPAEFVLHNKEFQAWSYVWQGGRRRPRVSDGYVGDIVLDNSLLKVKGFSDPTPQEAFRGIELPKDKLVPVRSNWYKDKDGLKLTPRSTGEYSSGNFVKDGSSKRVKPKPFFVYCHAVRPVSSLSVKQTPFPFMKKVYCENVITRASLIMGIDEWAKREIRGDNERKKRIEFAKWVKYCNNSDFFRIT